MADPVRLQSAADEVFCRLLEDAWDAEGLAWSAEPPRPSARLLFEDDEWKGGDGW